MKYIVLVCDGMADEPIDELKGQTPTQAAKTPNMDRLAQQGVVGRAAFTPEGMYPGSDVANMAILGYDPHKYHTGRAPLEAANQGIKLGPNDIAFRCNLVTASKDTMIDFAGGHIATKEATILIDLLNKKLGSDTIKFYPGVSYRHILVISDAKLAKQLKDADCTPPHDLTGKKYTNNLPKGKGAKLLNELMQKSRDILAEHDVNTVRIDLGENPANMIWLWGQGTTPSFPSFEEKRGLKGSMISAVDLLNGIARLTKLDIIQVPGATGYYDTNFLGKAEYGMRSLEKKDFIFIHVEAADEAGHNGDLKEKIRAIENFDSQVVAAVLKYLERETDYRILICPDHPTPVALKTHTSTPVLFLMYGKGIEANGAKTFDEETAAKSKLVYSQGFKLMDDFLNPQFTGQSRKATLAKKI